MKKKINEKWIEAIAHCSVPLHGGEARRFVRRHARLTKDTSYNPHTYVEVELTVPWLEWQDDDECTLNETTLMIPGFAQCMHMDKFDRDNGIVQAWGKAYEDLVKIVEKYRPQCASAKKKLCSEKQFVLDNACQMLLARLFDGGVREDTLISKANRDSLVAAGLAGRVFDYSFITPAGARRFLDISQKPEVIGENCCDPVPSMPKEDDQAEGPSSGQCCIDLDGCCDKKEE